MTRQKTEAKDLILELLTEKFYLKVGFVESLLTIEYVEEETCKKRVIVT